SRQVELEAVIREIQERVRARYPVNTAGPANVPLADLLPLMHARDRAESKVAAICTGNPPPAGFGNSLIQSFKRGVARGLNWFIRDQIEFNRAAMDCVHVMLEAMNENNRAISSLAAHLTAQLDARFEELRSELRAATDRMATVEQSS